MHHPPSPLRLPLPFTFPNNLNDGQLRQWGCRDINQSKIVAYPSEEGRPIASGPFFRIQDGFHGEIDFPGGGEVIGISFMCSALIFGGLIGGNWGRGEAQKSLPFAVTRYLPCLSLGISS